MGLSLPKFLASSSARHRHLTVARNPYLRSLEAFTDKNLAGCIAHSFSPRANRIPNLYGPVPSVRRPVLLAALLCSALSPTLCVWRISMLGGLLGLPLTLYCFLFLFTRHLEALRLL
eukprot:RCo055210